MTGLHAFALVMSIAVVALIWAFFSWRRGVAQLDALLDGPLDDGPDVLDHWLAETPLFAATVADMSESGQLAREFAEAVEKYLKEAS
jgi:hypothetical protein